MPLSSETHIHSGLASGALPSTRHVASVTAATQYPARTANLGHSWDERRARYVPATSTTVAHATMSRASASRPPLPCAVR